MRLHPIAQVVRARWRLVLLTAALSVAGALATITILPASYQAEASIVIGTGNDALTGNPALAALQPGYLATQVNLLGSHALALRVVDALRLADSPGVQAQFEQATGGQGSVRDWLADALAKRLDITSSKESTVLMLGFRGAEPHFAAAVANAFAEQFIKMSAALKAQTAQNGSRYIDRRLAALRAQLGVANARLSAYQQEHGLVADDAAFDVASRRLTALSSQLVQAEDALAQAQARAAAPTSVDLAPNGALANLKSNAGASQASLAGAAQRLGPRHPDYLSAEAGAARLQNAVDAQAAAARQSLDLEQQAASARVSALKAAVATQQATVLAANRERATSAAMQRERDAAEQAYLSAAARRAPMGVEATSELSDVSLLSPATAPTEPATPRVPLCLSLAASLGVALGIGLAMLAETLTRPLRDAADVQALDIPVLGQFSARVRQRNAPPPRAAS